jgi:hypothetical protein
MKKAIGLLLMSVWFYNLTFLKNHHLTEAQITSILGQSGTLIRQKDSTGAGFYMKYSRTYSTNITETESNLFYYFERSATAEEADKKINNFIESNKNGDGYESLKNHGDEGFFKTDNRNYNVVVARKGKVIVYLKVNKITSKTNVDALKSIAKELIDKA